MSKEWRKAYNHQYNLEVRGATKRRVIEQLGGKCVRCGSVDRLQFDHVDRTTKTKVIGSMLTQKEATLQAELAKCQLLCQPCHSLKSIIELGNQPRRHGTTTMYAGGKCRCPLCRAAQYEYVKEYRKRNGRKKYPRRA